MNVALTSISAYHKIGADREVMCKTLTDLYRAAGPLTDREAGRILDWHPSQVSARRNDLEGIVEFGVKKDPITNKTGKMWGFASLFS